MLLKSQRTGGNAGARARVSDEPGPHFIVAHSNWYSGHSLSVTARDFFPHSSRFFPD